MSNRDESQGQSDTHVIVDSKPWNAGYWVEADLERRMEMRGTLWLEEGSGAAWWTYGMGVDVYSRDEGDVGGGKEEGGGRRDGAEVKDNRLNIK